MPKAKQDTGNYYAAFIRGINVGGNSIIKMEDLKKIFKGLGFTNPTTILASGNVVFASEEKDESKLTKLISAKLEKIVGRKISVIVRSVEDIREVLDSKPFKNVKLAPGTKTFITFIPVFKKSGNASKSVTHDNYTIVEITNGMIVSMLHIKPGIGTLDLMEGIEKEFGKDVTTRTWGTIGKVLKAAH